MCGVKTEKAEKSSDFSNPDIFEISFPNSI
jgi:hypothetical protein